MMHLRGYGHVSSLFLPDAPPFFVRRWLYLRQWAHVPSVSPDSQSLLPTRSFFTTPRFFRLIRTCLVLAGVLWSAAATGQNYYRMRADFTIKEKNVDTTASLVMGTVYYDKFEKRIVYQITFPKAETWVHADTSVYRLVDGKVQDRKTLPNIMEFTMFHLALNQNLTDFGMKNSIFKISEVSREGDQVLTTWAPPPSWPSSSARW